MGHFMSMVSVPFHPAVLQAYCPWACWILSKVDVLLSSFFPSDIVHQSYYFSDYLETAFTWDSHTWLVNRVLSVFVIYGGVKTLQNDEVVLLLA